MSNQTYTIPSNRAKVTEVGNWLSSIQLRLHRLGTFWAQKRTRARELQELRRFSDRDLWDVGLSRSDILGIERGTYSRN